jgi:hypothetical protein
MGHPSTTPAPGPAQCTLRFLEVNCVNLLETVWKKVPAKPATSFNIKRQPDINWTT